MEHIIYDWVQAFDDWQQMPEVSFVGLLPDRVVEQVGLRTEERRVMIHRETVEHIHERRGPKSKRANIAIKGLSETVLLPDYVGLRLETSGRTSVICVKELYSESILVAVKFVPASQAKTQQDELWISSVYQILPKYLRIALERGRLQKVTNS